MYNINNNIDKYIYYRIISALNRSDWSIDSTLAAFDCFVMSKINKPIVIKNTHVKGEPNIDPMRPVMFVNTNHTAMMRKIGNAHKNISQIGFFFS